MLTELLANSLSLESIFIFLFMGIGLIIAVTIHEFAHAFVADRLGDPTARLMGRVTLNPLAHLDPMGTLAILLVGFGWGKPVPFDPFNLRSPRRDAALISLAGPLSNIAVVLVLAILLRLINQPWMVLFVPLIQLNLMLALFNLIPIHPLDGFKIVGGILPEEQAQEWDRLASYGLYIILFLLLPITPRGSIVGQMLTPVLDFVLHVLVG